MILNLLPISQKINPKGDSWPQRCDNAPMNSTALKALVPAVILLILGAGLYMALTTPPAEMPTALRSVPEHLRGAALAQSRPVAPFSLNDHNGAPFSEEQLKGKWSLIFFGYTYCPDICPTTLAVLSAMKQSLGSAPELLAETQFVMVSLDPQRDTPEKLGPYIQYFDPGFIAATGEREMIDRLTSSLNIPYAIEGDTKRDDYLVNHSATIALIDPQGQMSGRFNPPHFPERMAKKYQEVVHFLRQ